MGHDGRSRHHPGDAAATRPKGMIGLQHNPINKLVSRATVIGLTAVTTFVFIVQAWTARS